MFQRTESKFLIIIVIGSLLSVGFGIWQSWISADVITLAVVVSVLFGAFLFIRKSEKSYAITEIIKNNQTYFEDVGITERGIPPRLIWAESVVDHKRFSSSGKVWDFELEGIGKRTTRFLADFHNGRVCGIATRSDKSQASFVKYRPEGTLPSDTFDIFKGLKKKADEQREEET